MDTLLLTFANQSQEPLPSLQDECDTLHRLLAPRGNEQHFQLVPDPFVTLEKLPGYFSLYRDSLAIFLFSGHAGRDQLLLADGSAHGGGLAQMLALCKNLKLVFLNGCSTDGQVEALLENGVPVVIATSAPVSDRRATEFSKVFFQALRDQFSLRDAFEMAKGAAQSKDPGLQIETHRNIKRAPGASEQPVWGMFFLEKNEHVASWTLPTKAFVQESDIAGYQPNHQLVDTLFKVLGEYSKDDQLQLLILQAARGQQVPRPKKNVAVLNALPAPLAEPLRKLLVSTEQEGEGYDKPSAARLEQIAQAYSTTMEMLAFTMLAQLWEAHDNLGKLHINPAQRAALQRFFHLSETERKTFDLAQLVADIKGVFDQNNITYFVQELFEINEMMRMDEAFAQAVQLLGGLRAQILAERLDRSAIGHLCVRAEDALSKLYASMGFMARYRLATVKGIDLEKYRHRREPLQYNHATVMLYDLLGGFYLREIPNTTPLDNRSILLLNEDTWEFLNLSPFVIDENAFFERREICKLYFFSHWKTTTNQPFFKYVNKPEELLLIPDADPEKPENKLWIVKEQLQTFAQRILQSSPETT